MALHDDLLALARRLVPPPEDNTSPLTLTEADLRRGVSTAYYALFHLLIHEAMARIVADSELRFRVSRTFDHGKMKQVCEEYSNAKEDKGVLKVRAGDAITPKLKDIGNAFVQLQLARHNADYNTATPLRHPDADLKVSAAEVAFLDWVDCQADPSSSVFLTELFVRSVLRRER